jgi:hypothetical protein
MSERLQQMNRRIDKSAKNKKKDRFFETICIEPTTNPPKAGRIDLKKG